LGPKPLAEVVGMLLEEVVTRKIVRKEG
jgi:hypothetical protein